MSKTVTKKEAKLKGSVEDLVEPLLKRIISMGDKRTREYGPRNEDETSLDVEKLSRLVEAIKGLVESRQKCESELFGCIGKIERKIEDEENNEGQDTWAVLSAKLEELLKKQGEVLDLPAVKVNYAASHQEGNKNFEVGEPSNNKEVDPDYLGKSNKIARGHLYLRVFPENAITKKHLLRNWCTVMDDDVSFSYLVYMGFLEPMHAKKHNHVVDQWVIHPSFYDPSIQSRDIPGISTSDWALLNRDQKYLSSEDLKKLFNDFAPEIVHLGNWRCTDLQSQCHIEVDATDFSNKLHENTRYLSLRGISRIDELPESIGKLPNLVILDLRACHNLQQLPQKPQSKRRQGNWFKSLKYLDISGCYLLDHMPKWIGEIYGLEVLNGFVVGGVSKKQQPCHLRDLSKLMKLRKLTIRIAKHFDSEDASGMQSMDQLSVLTVLWGINEYYNENKEGKAGTISFPKNLEKLDLRGYPEAEAGELNPAALPKLKRLYIRGGKLTKIESGSSGWEVLDTLRLRFLKNFGTEWSEVCAKFPRLEYLEYEGCSHLKTFPENRTTWNMKKDVRSFSDGADGECTSNMKDQSSSDGADEPLIENNCGRIELKIIHNSEAPLAKNEKKLMLQLTAGNFIREGPGVDLVVVLDVSREEPDHTLEKIKKAIVYLIRELRPVDRLSIVTFCTSIQTVWPLQVLNRRSQKELEHLVNSLKSYNTTETNIYHGLQVGLEILKKPDIRSQSQVKSIILVSCCKGTDPSNFSEAIGDISVHAFGFGKYYDPHELQEIALETRGTYSEVRNEKNLTKAFAVCLAGLHSVAAQDLKLTLKCCKLRSSVRCHQLHHRYPWEIEYDGHATIKFKDLYSSEVRKVLVNFSLPAVDEEGSADIFEVFYSYKLSGKDIKANPVIIDVKRMQKVPDSPQHYWDIIVHEEARLKIVEMIKEATLLSYDLDDMTSARAKIIDANNILKHIGIKQHTPNELFGELQMLMEMMQSNDWHAFAYSLLSSLKVQRAAARGTANEKSTSYATPAMLQSLKDAEKFDVNYKPRRKMWRNYNVNDNSFEAEKFCVSFHYPKTDQL